MKVVLLTPYSPLLSHDHAANDLAHPLVESLASKLELHVYAPGQRNANLASWCANGVTYHAGSDVHRTRADRLDIYPFSARGSWSRRSTREAEAVVRAVRPEIVHAEYSQTAEAMLRVANSYPTTITLHDLPGEIELDPGSGVSLRRRLFQKLENAKARRLQSLIINRIHVQFVFSERDMQKIAGPGRIVRIVPIGISASPHAWVGDRAHSIAFGGAMWRLENEATASYLACEIMPALRRRIPDVELRIFGARPTETVRALADLPGVTVLGGVDDYDEEFCRAGVTVAPAMVEAGVLMKALRAMEMGCPVVLNSASSKPIQGLTPGVHALVGDTPSEIAEKIHDLMVDRTRARELGEAARTLVREEFRWSRTSALYCDAFEELLKRAE